MQRNNRDMIIYIQHTSVLKAQPGRRTSNIYIYLYVSDQSMYNGSEILV